MFLKLGSAYLIKTAVARELVVRGYPSNALLASYGIRYSKSRKLKVCEQKRMHMLLDRNVKLMGNPDKVSKNRETGDSAIASISSNHILTRDLHSKRLFQYD